MTNTKISAPVEIVAASITRRKASGMVMKKRVSRGCVTVDRASALYLLAEAGMTEPLGQERCRSGVVTNFVLPFAIPRALRARAERLYVDLGQALGAAHDVGGVDGLVGGDHDHLPHAILHALVGHLAGAANVNPHGLAGFSSIRGTCL